MDHVITTAWFGCDHVISLSNDQFQNARQARDILISCLRLEESYDICVLNYVSFESSIFSAAIETVISNTQNRHEFDNIRREIDRHLVNILASGEMYSEHAERLLKTASRKNWPVDQEAAVNKRASLEADLPGFHAMRWLRNAVLHQTLPISSWSFSSSWTNEKVGTDARRQQSISISFDVSLLNSLRDLPPGLREAIERRANSKGHIQWLPLIREYLEGISQLNSAMREALLPGERAGAALLNAMTTQYRAPFGGHEPISVLAVRREHSGKWLEHFALDFDYEERISSLRHRNRNLINLRKIEIIS